MAEVKGYWVAAGYNSIGIVSSGGAGMALAEWVASAWQIEDGFVTLPGVFSAEGPDRASVLLAAALPPKLPPAVADFGAGWGYLSRAILARQGVSSLDLIEAEADALDCARVNITDPRARFHWADATTIRPAKLWDAVVMNPPFHNGREADPGLGIAFIRAAQKAGPNLTTDTFIKAMYTMVIPPDMFGSSEATFSPTKRLGSDLSRLSQIQDGKWKVVSDYVKP